MAEDTPDLVVPEEQAAPELSRQAKRLARAYRELNRGGAPVSPEFVQAALDQGLSAQDVRAILRAQALGGPRTSASYSSSELLDYFTENPGEIPGLLQAVQTTAAAPATYAEYLAQGGEPGGYRSQNQLLQESVLGIGGARDAYLAGTTRQMFINEGNDPNRWYLDRDDFINGLADQEGADEAGADAGVPQGLDMNQLTSLSEAAQGMLQARSRRAGAYSDYFSVEDLTEEM